MGRRLTLKPFKSRGKWWLYLPARMTSDGKEKQESFPTKQAAMDRAAELTRRRIEIGEEASTLGPRECLDALDAMELLPDDVSLTDAAKAYVRRKEIETKGISFEDLAKEYLAENPQLSSKQASALKSIGKNFGVHLTGITADITAADIVRALKAEAGHLSGNTWNRHRTNIGTLMKYGMVMGYHSADVIELVQRQKHQKEDPRALGIEGCKSLILAADEYEGGTMLPFYTLTLFCGMRPTEASRVKWSDIHLDAGRPYIALGRNKTAPRTIYLMPNSVAWLNRSKKKVLGISSRYDERTADPRALDPKGFKLRPMPWRIEGDGFTNRSVAVRKAAEVYKDWQNDIMRHTAVSMHYAYHQDEKAVVAWAGHSIQTHLKHYRVAITREQAEEFWGIMPPEK